MCVCVQLVSCVEMLVFSSIIESFWMFNFLYDIFNECNFFLYAGPSNWKYALFTHRGFETVAFSISSAKFI